MSRKSRRRQRDRRKKSNGHRSSVSRATQPLANNHTNGSTRIGNSRLELPKTRRAFLRAVANLALTVTGGALGNIWASRWERRNERAAKVDYFFLLFETEQFAQAYEVGLEILARLPRDSMELGRWLNNVACAAVWEGDFRDARALLLRARTGPKSWWTAMVECNLAYVEYHLGGDTRSLIPRVKQAIRTPLTQDIIRDQHWLQLWSRQPRMSTPWVPPFGVLLRLYAKDGQFSDAYASGQADLRSQGYRAQGSRVLLGLIARPIQSEKLSLQYLDEVSEEHNPPSSWDHMRAERDLIVADLTRRSLPSDWSFINQAASAKGVYYSWTSLADLRYFLAADVSRAVKYEYGRQLLAGYKEAGHADQEAIRRIATMVP
jgi:hypothetical protein